MGRRLALLLLLLLISACAHKATPPVEQKAPCTELWVYAPENYVLEVATGEDVLLNPRVWTFPLFCSQNEAEKALARAKNANSIPKGRWALFTIEPIPGSGFSRTDLINTHENGERTLLHPALLRTWKTVPW